MSVKGLTIKLLDGVTYNNPNIGEMRDGKPTGVMLKQGSTTVIPYDQVKQIKQDLERGKIVIVGLIDDEMGSVGVPSKDDGSAKATGPAAAKQELEFEIKNNIKSEPHSLVKIKEDRFNPASEDKMIEVRKGETHEESQERMRDAMSEKNHQDIKDEIAAVSKNKAAQGPVKKIEGRNANQELKDELVKNSVKPEAPAENAGGTEATDSPAPDAGGPETTETPAPDAGGPEVMESPVEGEKEKVGAAKDDNVGW